MIVITCIFQNIGFNIANTLCLQKSYLQLPQTLLFMHRFWPFLMLKMLYMYTQVCLIILTCQQKWKVFVHNLGVIFFGHWVTLNTAGWLKQMQNLTPLCFHNTHTMLVAFIRLHFNQNFIAEYYTYKNCIDGCIDIVQMLQNCKLNNPCCYLYSELLCLFRAYEC